MKHYKIVLEIEFDADSPLEAAKELQRRCKEDDDRYIYVVQDDQSGEVVTVDLDEEDDDAVLPYPDYVPMISDFPPNHLQMERDRMIENIHRIVAEYGETSSTELELNSSPCIFSKGDGRYNVSQLVERFHTTSVSTVTYRDDSVLDEDEVQYEDLSDDILSEIEMIMEDYEASELQTLKRISDE